MRTALIGYSGFVGSNLRQQMDFTHLYNSSNFADMRHQQFDIVYCAGIQAVKWWANQNPDQDWAGIAPLLDVLSTVRANRFVHISTVDVYQTPNAVNEDTSIITDGLHPYGAHRWQVEEFVRTNYDTHTIVRLPGLFGSGLKKNLIYDVITGKDISGFDARSSFQFYDLARITGDIQKTIDANAPTVNFATAPVSVGDTVKRLTGQAYDHTTENGPASYDMRTKYASIWGLNGSYLADDSDVLNAISGFANSPESPASE